jgi:hypothetical protein
MKNAGIERIFRLPEQNALERQGPWIFHLAHRQIVVADGTLTVNAERFT